MSSEQREQRIRVAIVGLGNCASALVQGLYHYSAASAGADDSAQDGLVRPSIGPYRPSDIDVVVAYDVDLRKIGWSINQAIFKGTNCCMPLAPEMANDGPDTAGRFDGPVLEAPILDGVAPHMATTDATDKERFCVKATPVTDATSWAYNVPASVGHFAEELKTYGVDALVNYLPVGSQKATEFWAEVCLAARVPFVNCIPVFIASNPAWSARFRDARVALIGDDMKSQFGASVLSQALQELAEVRGHRVKVHIQQNSGGNTDFFNMTSQERLASKKISKENVIKDHGCDTYGPPEFYHAGPSDYIRAYGDTKVAHFRLELTGFGGAPVKLDARLEVQDSPNSAGVVIDAVRYAVVAQQRGIYGALEGPSAFTQKSPPVALSLAEAIEACDELAA
jgi:myo-inositol-1-phosphate synthase